MIEKSRYMPIQRGAIYGLLQRSRIQNSSFALAVTAPQRGSGVTYISQMIAEFLNHDVPGSAVVLDCRALSSEEDSTNTDSLSTPDLKESWRNGGGWRGSVAFRDRYIASLQQSYDYVVLDCPALSESSEVLALPERVGGVLCVVEANRTTKAQVAFVERSMREAGSKFLGHVLNKRTYVLPTWLHKGLQRIGA